jgi:hypothetical protein
MCVKKKNKNYIAYEINRKKKIQTEKIVNKELYKY